MAGPWLQQQRAGISIAGDGADSHDDFKPVQKDGSALPSVQEHIEKVITTSFLSMSFALRLLIENTDFSIIIIVFLFKSSSSRVATIILTCLFDVDRT